MSPIIDRDRVVQVIVVRDNKNERMTSNEVIAGASKASVAALDSYYDASWDAWLQGAFTKSVRRAKPKEFYNILNLDIPHEVINSNFVAFKPMLYADLPRELVRTQVSGLVTSDEGSDYSASTSQLLCRSEKLFNTTDEVMSLCNSVGATTIVLNNELGMSVGKAAAQAAHALMLFWLRSPLAYRVKYAAKGYPVRLIHANEDLFKKAYCQARHSVRDIGLTEVPEGSITALVL